MYINKRGVALAALGVLLVIGAALYARGPSYLRNPVVTATVTACHGKAADRYCVGSWPAGTRATHNGGIEDLGKAQVGDHIKVRPKSEGSATTQLNMSVGGWIFRELISAALLAGAVVIVIYLIRRRRRYVEENPDRRPELDITDPK